MKHPTLKRNFKKNRKGENLKKRCTENMQQIYRRTSIPKYDFSKVALGCSPVNLLHIFRTPFLKKTSGRLLLTKIIFKVIMKTMGTLFSCVCC